MELVVFAELYILIQWLIVKLPQFWPCLIILTVLPSTISETIFELFLLQIIIFSLIFFLKMYSSSILNRVIKTRNFVLLPTSE